MIRAQKHQKMAYSNSISIAIASNSAKKVCLLKKKYLLSLFIRFKTFLKDLPKTRKGSHLPAVKEMIIMVYKKKHFAIQKWYAPGIMIAQVYLPLLRNSNY